MHDHGYIFVFVSALLENNSDLLQICDSIQVRRRLLAAEAAIQVTADGGMQTVACKLADMINMIGYIFHNDLWIFLFAVLPIRMDHPVIKRSSDHAVSRNDGTNLLVIKLSLMRHECAGI